MHPLSARIHDRVERHGVDRWAAREPGASEASQHHCELTSESYEGIFRELARLGGRSGLTDLGAGCGLAVALAVGGRTFRRSCGVEVVAARVAAANEALRSLGLRKRAVVALGSFHDEGFAIETPCALSVDVAFARPELEALARALEASPACRAFVSFRAPRRWAAAGLRSYEPASSARAATSGGERFTYTVYVRVRHQES